jgi:hypothetical protein
VLRRFVIVGSTAFVFTSALMASLGAASGCRHDREPPPPVVDAPKVDVEQDSSRVVPPVTVLDNGEDKTADLSCLGMPRVTPPIVYPPEAGVDDAEVSDAAPAPGTVTEKEIELIGFGTGGADKLKNQTVDVFYNNTFKGTPDQTVTTDDKGITKVLLPQGVRIGYHVRPSTVLDHYYGLDDLHEPAKYPGSMNPIIRWQGVTLERRDFFALALTSDKNWRPKPGNGILAGRVMDCKRRYMQYAEIELIDEDTKEKFTWGKCGEAPCRVFLTDSELPDPGREYTSRSSLFILLDLPVGKNLRVVAYGRDDKGNKTEVAWRKIELTPDTITTQFLEPNNPK